MPDRYYVTARMLERQNACSQSVWAFRKTFGDRAEVTPENVRRALRDDDLRASWLPFWAHFHANRPNKQQVDAATELQMRMEVIEGAISQRAHNNAARRRPTISEVIEYTNLLRDCGALFDDLTANGAWTRYKEDA